MSDDASDDRKVGYKQPPKHSRFQPGRSGNPGGREKGVRNLASDVKRTLAAPVTVTVNETKKKISTQEAALGRLKEKALKGDRGALEQLLRLAQTFNNEVLSEVASAPDLEADDQTILDAYVESRLPQPSSKGTRRTQNEQDAGSDGDE
jgi:Family of unknown function (DUF5681)